MTLPRTLPLLFAASSTTFAGDAKSPAATGGDWEFSLSAGPAWRQAGKLGFSGGSRSAGIFIPSFVGENSLTTPRIGPENQIGERFYNDGYVRADGSTELDGLTQFWGYQNAAQVSGDDLTFHATGFQSIRSDIRSIGTAPSFDRHEQGIVPVIQFDGRYKHQIGGIQPGFSAGLSWIPVNMDRSWRDFSLAQTRDDFRHDWTDVYNLGGFGDEIPSAPYSGTFEGPGFILENIPDSRNRIVAPIGSETVLLDNPVTTRFRADHTTVSFGPTLARQLAPEWSLQAGIGVSLHWLHWSASQNERLTVSQGGTRTVFGEWNDTSSGNKILGGLYLQIVTEWAPRDQDWSLKGLLRTDIGQKFTEDIGPGRITYDVDGFTAAVMISHTL